MPHVLLATSSGWPDGEPGAPALDAALAARGVDMMRLPDGTLAVSELEVSEPGLYLDVLPGNGDAVAGLLATLVH